MSSRPAVTGKKAVRTLKRFGFVLDRVEGSHHILRRPGHPTPVPVPVHSNRDIPYGTLRKILELAGVREEDFYQAF